MDADFTDWCDDARISRFKAAIKPIIDTLRWDNDLERVCLTWVIWELVLDLYNEDYLSNEEKSSIISQAKESFDKLKGQKDVNGPT